VQTARALSITNRFRPLKLAQSFEARALRIGSSRSSELWETDEGLGKVSLIWAPQPEPRQRREPAKRWVAGRTGVDEKSDGAGENNGEAGTTSSGAKASAGPHILSPTSPR